MHGNTQILKCAVVCGCVRLCALCVRLCAVVCGCVHYVCDCVRSVCVCVRCVCGVCAVRVRCVCGVCAVCVRLCEFSNAHNGWIKNAKGAKGAKVCGSSTFFHTSSILNKKGMIHKENAKVYTHTQLLHLLHFLKTTLIS